MSKNSRNHKISQNFLRSPKIALMLVGHTNIRKKDFTLDIGAGSGVFTYALSKKSKQVLAIEFDRQAFLKLKNNTSNLENVEILNANFLNFHLSKLPKDYKVCSNIPFHLSSQIISKILTDENSPKSAFFILQRQFAKKIVPGGNHFTSALSAKIFPYFNCKIKKPLHKNDFTPPPNVDTVFFEMKRRDNFLIPKKDQADYNDFIDRMYADSIFYRKNSGIKFKDKKPSELEGEDWVEIWTQI